MSRKRPSLLQSRSEERRVGKEWRSLCDWSSDVCSSDLVFETRLIDVAKDGTTIEVKPTSDWGGGAYAIVSLYRPLASGRPHDPVRAVGLAWMGVDVSQKTLSVAI